MKTSHFSQNAEQPMLSPEFQLGTSQTLLSLSATTLAHHTQLMFYVQQCLTVHRSLALTKHINIRTHSQIRKPLWLQELAIPVIKMYNYFKQYKN